MATMSRRENAEFGDFQTPPVVAEQICRLLLQMDVRPASIVEPTCGIGNLLFAAYRSFPTVSRALGIDVSARHIAAARRRQCCEPELQSIEVLEGDFFRIEWLQLLSSCADPILVIGNPPWVTNTDLSKLGSGNVPKKSNRHGLRLSGYEAVSGKSNFDISEWMLTRLLDSLDGRTATLAMLCKTSVARKALLHAWRSGIRVREASMYLIDAERNFGAAVDACLLICALAPSGDRSEICKVFPSLSSRALSGQIGYIDDHLIADVDSYLRWRALLGSSSEGYCWRSGIKHDCAPVMELRRTPSGYLNGLSETVDIEEEYVFPLFKSSDVARGETQPKRHLLIPQRHTGDDTAVIQHFAPKTWAYLQEHASFLDRRRSSIYAGRPRFAIFGVGDYTFAPWKVAVSGMYKDPVFRVIAPFQGKPSVLDDTCYFVPCYSEEEAVCVRLLLDSDPAHGFYRAFLFPDSKRPVTAELLRRLDLSALAGALGLAERFAGFLHSRPDRGDGASPAVQGELFAH